MKVRQLRVLTGEVLCGICERLLFSLDQCIVVSITRAVIRIIYHHAVVKHAFVKIGKSQPSLVACVLRLQLKGISKLLQRPIEVIHEEEVNPEAVVRLVRSRLLFKSCIEDFTRFQKLAVRHHQ